MTASNDAFRRISPLLRTMRIALTVSDDACVLMDDVRIEKRPDGTVAERFERRTGSDLDDLDRNCGSDVIVEERGAFRIIEDWSPLDPVITSKWVLTRVGQRANRVWHDMLTEEERRAIGSEGTPGDDAVTRFLARVMRRVLGYHQTAEKAASLCSLALCRMLDPEMVKALRHICGWGSRDATPVIRAWDRIDAEGRQIGLKARPVQVACLARLIARNVLRDTHGNVGMLAVMESTRAAREREDHLYMTAQQDIEHPALRTTSQVEDLCEIADLLPSVLRSAGVKPAFWRMILRMRPAQILAMRDLFARSWDDRTTRILNTFALLGEDLLPPTLIRELCRLWSVPSAGVQTAIGLEIARRAAEGVSNRRRRQSLRDAVAKISEVTDHVMHRIEARIAEMDAASGRTPTHGLQENWVQLLKRIETQDSERIALIPVMLPRNRTWSGLVADSDIWHEESILAMDEGDDRTWSPLIEDPIRIGDVEVAELHSAAALRCESRELNHCVGTGGYADRCMRGGTRILSLRMAGRRTRSTMEIASHHGTWTSVQHRGRANSVPKPMLLAAVAGALRAVNRAQRIADDDARPARLAA